MGGNMKVKRAPKKAKAKATKHAPWYLKIQPWTLFWDMHSGGGTKEGNYNKIYIQAPEAEAMVIFYKRFGHNPYRVTCTCCGDDYSVTESKNFAQASGYHRDCEWLSDAKGKYITESDGGGYVEKPSRKLEHRRLIDYE